MKAIVFEAPRRLRLVDDAPVPAPEDRQVLVRCTHVGLCGSSMGAYTAEGCWAAARRPSAPGWMGHENVGVIVDSRHPDWRAGTRVLAQPKYWDGFAEYFVAAAEETVRLPEDAPDPGAYVVAQPLATVLHALSRTGPVIGQRCAVVGQGPIGLIFTEILSRMGAEQVIAIDLVGWRLEWARRLGATDVVDASTGDAIQDVRDLTSGAMVDLSVEAGNTAEALVLAARLPRRKGRLVPFGVQHEEMTLFPWAFSNGNCTEILCSNGHGGLLRSAVGWIARGRTDLACIVTPRLPWCRAEEAFEMYTHPAAHPGSLKVTLVLDEQE